MPTLYGANVDGVRALLPHRRIAVDTRPTQEAVDQFLEAGSARVRARTGDLTGHADTAALSDAARSIVELLAAAMAEDAAFPERASVADTDYGNVLWTRAGTLLDELIARLDTDGDGVIVPGDGSTSATSPVGAFPEPLFVRAQGF